MDLNYWINFIKEKFGSMWVIILLPIVIIMMLILSAIGLSLMEIDKYEEIETLEIKSP